MTSISPLPRSETRETRFDRIGGLIALAYFVLRARRAATHRAMAVAALYGHFLAVGLSVPFPAAVEMRPGA